MVEQRLRLLRFEALHTTDLTDLVGREEELELLLRRWPRAKTGEGQVVLLSGEAGIGKIQAYDPFHNFALAHASCEHSRSLSLH